VDIFHYTDKSGWNGIRSQRTWQFKAMQPIDPDRPFGAYFTDIPPTEENLRTLHKRIRVPKIKQQYLFWFTGSDGLQQHNGGSGRDKRIFYSSADYDVVEERQEGEGETDGFTEFFS
jgi:hypothetical protein